MSPLPAHSSTLRPSLPVPALGERAGRCGLQEQEQEQEQETAAALVLDPEDERAEGGQIGPGARSPGRRMRS